MSIRLHLNNFTNPHELTSKDVARFDVDEPLQDEVVLVAHLDQLVPHLV